jgi:predicted Zn-dependent peptidase
MPVLKPARNLPSPVTRVTVLPNKLRVATEETYGQVSDPCSRCGVQGALCGSCQGVVPFNSAAHRVAVGAAVDGSQVATIGLFVDAGSMYEVESTRGAGHFLQNLAFKSTTRMSQEQILQYVRAVFFVFNDWFVTSTHVLSTGPTLSMASE